MTAQGLLLAAGAGTRMGQPKALVSDEGGSWLERGVRVLDDGGCDGVTVVLGARSSEAVVLPRRARRRRGHRPRLGVGHVGLPVRGAAGDARATPPRPWCSWSTSPTSRPTWCAGWSTPAPAPGALARASYDGRPGHPVLIGRDHWAGVLATATGDRGARDYLETHEAVSVECGDLATGVDVDSPTLGQRPPP